jgi:hypothetical protein
MTVFQGAVDATFAAFGIDALYTPVDGEPVSVRVIARRPDTIVGFGETRIHAETASFELRASEVASPRPDDQLTVGGETVIVQGEPERRDPDRSEYMIVDSNGDRIKPDRVSKRFTFYVRKAKLSDREKLSFHSCRHDRLVALDARRVAPWGF